MGSKERGGIRKGENRCAVLSFHQDADTVFSTRLEKRRLIWRIVYPFL
jgi:hypothetical protein